MAPLFGNRSEKAAREAAARAEVDRLQRLPLAGLAVEVMGAFGPGGISAGGRRCGPVEVVSWLLSASAAPASLRQPLLQPVIEALQLLVHAGLLSQRVFGERGSASTYAPTRLGEEALRDGSVAARVRA